MNSTQLHYREATRALDAARQLFCATAYTEAQRYREEAMTHALLACTAALAELTRQADPEATEAVAAAVGVLRPTPDNVTHHAFNAFGNPT